MKSTPALIRAAWAEGWRTALGSGERSAWTMPGELA